MPSILGIDVGTSAVKVACFDERGRVLGKGEQPLSVRHPERGWAEQELGEVLGALSSSSHEALRSLTAGQMPDLVGVTAQGDGCWLLDAAGHPVRPAISWMDGRAASIVGEWSRSGLLTEAFRSTANAVFPGCQAALLAWLERFEREALEASATAAYCKDAVMQRLTGLRATDPSDASLPFGKLDGGGYDFDVVSLLGLDHWAHLLPPVLSPRPIASLSAEGAAILGIRTQVPVVAGPLDLVACPIGAGALAPGDGLVILGTTLACEAVVAAADPTATVVGMHLATGFDGVVIRSLPAMVGTASVDWVLDLLRISSSELDDILATTSPLPLEVLPYLAPSGERAPFLDPWARGELGGLTLTTTREDLVRGFCEGVALAARDCVEALPPLGRLVVCGGGTRSPGWLRLMASVLGRPLSVVRGSLVGARGAAMAAAASVEMCSERWEPPPMTLVEPEPGLVERYDEAFTRFRCRRATLAERAGAGTEALV